MESLADSSEEDDEDGWKIQLGKMTTKDTHKPEAMGRIYACDLSTYIYHHAYEKAPDLIPDTIVVQWFLFQRCQWSGDPARTQSSVMASGPFRPRAKREKRYAGSRARA
jgi:hypothetical protein